MEWEVVTCKTFLINFMDITTSLKLSLHVWGIYMQRKKYTFWNDRVSWILISLLTCVILNGNALSSDFTEYNFFLRSEPEAILFLFIFLKLNLALCRVLLNCSFYSLCKVLLTTLSLLPSFPVQNANWLTIIHKMLTDSQLCRVLSKCTKTRLLYINPHMMQQT